jgi:hypothetical protein
MEDEECSLGERLMLVEALGQAASELGNLKDVITQSQYKEQQRMDSVKAENEFFNTTSIFDTPMVILGSLKRKLQPSKHKKG